MLEDSDFLYFKRISDGTGYADAVFMHTETSTPFYKATIAWNGNGWTLRLADGTEVRFPESYNAKNLAQGAAFELMDAAGDKLQFDRDRQRNLREILTPNGRSIRFEYDDQARIIRARDDNADSVRYGYNQDGMLIYAAQSSGAARVYQYQGFLMTAVMDERGRTLVRNWYDDSKILIAQVFANGDVLVSLRVESEQSLRGEGCRHASRPQ
jgi:YD repeat-containing protein